MNEYILNSLVMQKLTKEVNEWDPTKDTIMIHQWVCPWLPLMCDLE